MVVGVLFAAPFGLLTAPVVVGATVGVLLAAVVTLVVGVGVLLATPVVVAGTVVVLSPQAVNVIKIIENTNKKFKNLKPTRFNIP